MMYQSFIFQAQARRPGWMSLSPLVPTVELAAAWAKLHTERLRLLNYTTGSWPDGNPVPLCIVSWPDEHKGTAWEPSLPREVNQYSETWAQQLLPWEPPP